MSKKTPSKKNYPPEFREKAVRLITELGYTIDQVSEKLGCSRESVRRWKETAKPKLDPETVLRMELEENELKRLRNENKRLKMENDILKKATARISVTTRTGNNVTAKYAWINEHRNDWPVTVMCEVLDVSTSARTINTARLEETQDRPADGKSAGQTTTSRICRGTFQQESQDLRLQEDECRPSVSRNRLFAEHDSRRLQVLRDQKRYAKEISSSNDGLEP